MGASEEDQHLLPALQQPVGQAHLNSHVLYYSIEPTETVILRAVNSTGLSTDQPRVVLVGAKSCKPHLPVQPEGFRRGNRAVELPGLVGQHEGGGHRGVSRFVPEKVGTAQSTMST